MRVDHLLSTASASKVRSWPRSFRDLTVALTIKSSYKNEMRAFESVSLSRKRGVRSCYHEL